MAPDWFGRNKAKPQSYSAADEERMRQEVVCVPPQQWSCEKLGRLLRAVFEIDTQLTHFGDLEETGCEGMSFVAISDGVRIRDFRVIGYRPDMQPYEHIASRAYGLRSELDALQSAAAADGGPPWQVAVLRTTVEKRVGHRPDRELMLFMDESDRPRWQITADNFAEIARRVSPNVPLPPPAPREQVAPGRFALPPGDLGTMGTGAITYGAPLRQQIAEELAAIDTDLVSGEHAGFAVICMVGTEHNPRTKHWTGELFDDAEVLRGDTLRGLPDPTREPAPAITRPLLRAMLNVLDEMDVRPYGSDETKVAALIAARRSDTGRVVIKDYWDTETLRLSTDRRDRTAIFRDIAEMLDLDPDRLN